jgi:outer membrane protein
MFSRLILLFAIFTSSAFANYAVIDMQKIENQSLVAKDLKTKIEKASILLKEDVDKAKKKIEEEVAKLQKIAPTLTEDSLNTKRNNLQKDFINIESKLQERDEVLQEKRMKALEEINVQIKEISEKIAKQKNINLVLTSAVVIYYEEGGKNDITEDVLKELNNKIKKSSFEI